MEKFKRLHKTPKLFQISYRNNIQQTTNAIDITYST